MPETLDRPQQQQLPARQNGVGTLRINMKAPIQSAGTLKRFLEDENQKQKIADVLPKHMTPDRILRVALVAMNKTPKLLSCTLESVFECILQAASLGLDPGGALGSSYLIPYGNVCKLIPGYRGLLDLARRSGEIDSIGADVVYKHDKFTFRKGSDPVLIHEPDIFAEQKDQDIIGAYVVAHLKGGGKHIEFMNRQQLEKARSFSQSGRRSDSPWMLHFPEMCRKTVVRRASKYLPISSEKFATAIDLDNDSDGQLLPTPNAADRLNAKVNGALPDPEPEPGVDENLPPDDGSMDTDESGNEGNSPADDATQGGPTESDVAGSDAQPPSDEMPPLQAFLIQVEEACQSSDIKWGPEAQKALGKWALGAGPKNAKGSGTSVVGKEHQATPEAKAGLFESIRDKSGHWAFAR